MRSIVQFWACLLLLLGSALAIQSSPVYFYPQDPYNTDGVVVRSDLLPSLFNAIYDESQPSSKFMSKRNIAIGRGDGFRPGK